MFRLNDKKVFDNSEEYISNLLPKSGKSVIAICPTCNKKRDVPFYSVTTVGHTFCHDCSRINNTKDKYIGKTFGRLLAVAIGTPYISKNNNRHMRIKCLCSCGNKVEVLAQHLKRGSTVSCGCYNSDDKKAKCGSKHPNYKQDMTVEERKKLLKSRADGENRIWKTKVKEFANHKCSICGSSKNLQAHHIESFKDNEELRYDLKNGVCLCANCHKAYHIGFMHGYQKGATGDSFNEFQNLQQKEMIEYAN